MQPARRFFVAGRIDEAIDVEEQVLAGRIVCGPPNVALWDGIERSAQRVRVVGRDDALLGKHHEMGIVNGHQRRKKERLRILKVLVEHVLHVLGSERH